MRIMRRRGFTIIELITVMAISAILLGLIIVPLFQSFSLTRTAQAFADAQDRARILTERIAGEIGNASIVRGTGGVVQTTMNGAAAEVPTSTLIARMPRGENVDFFRERWPSRNNQMVDVSLPYSKLDLYLPAEGDPNDRFDGAYIDPVTGKADPTLQAPKGQVNLPAAQGAVLVRYFIALRDPFSPYNNPYDGLLAPRNASRDNLYVLYRAEVVPYVFRINKYGTAGSEALRPNLRFFESDDTDTRIVDFDDPRFVLADLDVNGTPISDDTTNAKARRIKNWLRLPVGTPPDTMYDVSPQATVTRVTDVSRYDMVYAQYDRGSRSIEPVDRRNFATAGIGAVTPRVQPLVQFRPSRINSDAAQPMLAARPGEESDQGTSVGSDVYMTQYGLWGSAVVRVFPRRWSQNDAARNEYLVAHRSPTDLTKPFSIYVYDPDTSGPADYLNPATREVFDLNVYDRATAAKSAGQRIYPFSEAVLEANANSGWLTNAVYRSIFTPFAIDRNRGRVLTSFGIDEVGSRDAPDPGGPNLPQIPVGADLTPSTDPSTPGNFFDLDYADSINRRYNKIYNDYPFLREGNVHRFIDLRATSNNDGSPSPLFPRALAGLATGFQYNTPDGGIRSKVTIVPGSDVVLGPDQLPGPNYGSTIRYTRITRGEPGPNQYRINYTDVQEPTNDAGQIDYTVLFPNLPTTELSGFQPRVYNRQNLISAVLQPRYKVGYVQLYSGAGVPIPSGYFRIYYRFTFTGAQSGSEIDRDLSGNVRLDVNRADSIAVDYDTRQLMDVVLTIRNYPQANVPNPQTVTLKATATLRNFTR